MVHQIWQDFPEIERDLYKVKQIMKKQVTVKAPDIHDRIYDYIDAPGKYIRSGLLLMFTRLSGQAVSQNKLKMAASIELFHLATLLHDDVIDGANQRRGIQTLQETHSNRMAIYAGDYLLAYAMRLAGQARPEGQVFVNDMSIELILAGEIQQLGNVNDSQMTMMKYLRQIKGKTALLFGLAAIGGYYEEGMSRSVQKKAYRSGLYIGMMFQLVDDLLDLYQSADQIGKPGLQDIQNGIYTAPVIYAMENKPGFRRWLANQNHWKDEDLDYLIKVIEASGGRPYVQSLIHRYDTKLSSLLQTLDHGEYHMEIRRLMDMILERTY